MHNGFSFKNRLTGRFGFSLLTGTEDSGARSGFGVRVVVWNSQDQIRDADTTTRTPARAASTSTAWQAVEVLCIDHHRPNRVATDRSTGASFTKKEKPPNTLVTRGPIYAASVHRAQRLVAAGYCP